MRVKCASRNWRAFSTANAQVALEADGFSRRAIERQQGLRDAEHGLIPLDGFQAALEIIERGTQGAEQARGGGDGTAQERQALRRFRRAHP